MHIFDILEDPYYHTFDEIHRFNMHPVIKKESDSQHSWWVTFFAKCVLDEALKNWAGHYQFKLMVLEAALLHDFPEIITGDMAHDVKYNEYNGSVLKQALNTYENEVLEKWNKRGGCFSGICDALATLDRDLVKSVVKVADWLATLKNILQEVRMGNRLMYDMFYRSTAKAVKEMEHCIRLMDAYNKNVDMAFNCDSLTKLKAQVGLMNIDQYK